MRVNVAITLLVGLTLLCSVPAFADSWHRPNVWEESNGNYTNYTFDDGLCRYTYSYNRYEKHAQASRHGDCSHLMIGPDGRVMQQVEEENED
jgi:hypothetical protein